MALGVETGTAAGAGVALRAGAGAGFGVTAGVAFGAETGGVAFETGAGVAVCVGLGVAAGAGVEAAFCDATGSAHRHTPAPMASNRRIALILDDEGRISRAEIGEYDHRPQAAPAPFPQTPFSWLNGSCTKITEFSTRTVSAQGCTPEFKLLNLLNLLMSLRENFPNMELLPLDAHRKSIGAAMQNCKIEVLRWPVPPGARASCPPRRQARAGSLISLTLEVSRC